MKVFVVCIGESCVAMRDLGAVKALLDRVYEKDPRKQLTIDLVDVNTEDDVVQGWDGNLEGAE